MKDDDFWIRQSAIRRLPREDLVQLIHGDADDIHRLTAIRLLDSDFLGELRRHLRSSVDHIRNAAATRLADAGNREALGILLQNLIDGGGKAGWNRRSYEVVAASGQKGVRLLVTALKNPLWGSNSVENTIQALGHPGAREAIPELRWQVRFGSHSYTAAVALIRVGDYESLPKLLHHPNRSVVKVAARALVQLAIPRW